MIIGAAVKPSIKCQLNGSSNKKQLPLDCIIYGVLEPFPAPGAPK